MFFIIYLPSDMLKDIYNPLNYLFKSSNYYRNASPYSAYAYVTLKWDFLNDIKY